jgi:peptidoglycan LD-endopeptidase LytH
MTKKIITILIITTAVLIIATYTLIRGPFSDIQRTRKVLAFIRNPQAHQDAVIPALSRCNDAPFIMPSTGLVGFLWGDSFRPGHQHQGIDIFAGTDVGKTAVYAAYAGYLTRMADWKSSVIIRIPSDPLQPNRQIWTYYTHMADPAGNSFIISDFPPGTRERYITAGTLLGYQGNYSGTPDNPTGVHLHFSIVRDDGHGKFLNELEINNTLDPSPYFRLPLNGRENNDQVPMCVP